MNIFRKKKKSLESGSYIDFDDKLPDEPATEAQKRAIRNLCRFVRKSCPSDRKMEKMTKKKASEKISHLLALAKEIRKEWGPRWVEDGPDDYLLDEQEDEYWRDRFGWDEEF